MCYRLIVYPSALILSKLLCLEKFFVTRQSNRNQIENKWSKETNNETIKITIVAVEYYNLLSLLLKVYLFSDKNVIFYT